MHVHAEPKPFPIARGRTKDNPSYSMEQAMTSPSTIRRSRFYCESSKYGRKVALTSIDPHRAGPDQAGVQLLGRKPSRLLDTETLAQDALRGKTIVRGPLLSSGRAFGAYAGALHHASQQGRMNMADLFVC